MKNRTFVFIKRKNGIHSAQREEVPEIRFLSFWIIIGWRGVSQAKQFWMKILFIYTM